MSLFCLDKNEGDLIHGCKSKLGVGRAVPDFLVVCSNRTRINGHKLNHTKFQLSWTEHGTNALAEHKLA